MPRSKLPKLDSKTFGSFEPRRKNPILLAEDSVLDNHQKSIRIGEKTSILSLSNDELRIDGDLFLDGKLNSHVVETDNEYLELIANQYIRFESSAYSGSLDLYVAGGDSYFLTSSDKYYFLSAATLTNIYMGGISYIDQVQFDFTNAHYDFKSSGSSSHYFRIDINGSGETTLKSVDGSGTSAHITMEADGDLILDPVSQKTIINATDGLYFDGGNDTYIYEAAADTLRVVVGGDRLVQLSEDGDDGNLAHFTSCVGFTQIEPTYDATATVVDFRHSNKQNLTFGSGNITNMDLYFPTASGNFVLLLKQDGTGSRTVTTWKAREFDESAADGSATVVWAGGSAPTLTTDANHVDILSFYWDADNEIAYGVATLDFQF